MNYYQTILSCNACYKRAFSKASMLIIILYFANCQAHAQFVDIAIDLHARIELTSMSPQKASQTPNVTKVDRPSAQLDNVRGLNWIRIRTAENMMLMVEIKYFDLAEGKTDRSAAYLNDGSDKIVDALFITGNRVNFPVNSNTWLMTRMNSPPQNLDAWIGIPAGLVRELTIEYN